MDRTLSIVSCSFTFFFLLVPRSSFFSFPPRLTVVICLFYVFLLPPLFPLLPFSSSPSAYKFFFLLLLIRPFSCFFLTEPRVKTQQKTFLKKKNPLHIHIHKHQKELLLLSFFLALFLVACLCLFACCGTISVFPSPASFLWSFFFPLCVPSTFRSTQVERIDRGEKTKQKV